MGLKRWNGTSWVPTIYQPTLNASEILNDSSVEGGNVKAALEKLAQGGGSGSSNIYIANLELGYSSGSYTVESGPTITELAAAYNANKQIFVKAAIEEDGMVMNFYGECVYAMSGEDIGYQGIYEFILKIEKAYAYDYTMMENLYIVTLNYPSEQTWDVYEEESGGGTWGSITGTLSNQTDLWNKLNSMVPSSGTTGYYLQKTSSGTQWAQVIPTTGTTGYYLQKTSSGTQWAAVQSGGIFYATYEEGGSSNTPYSDILAAYNAGKEIVLKYISEDYGTIYCNLIEFTAYSFSFSTIIIPSDSSFGCTNPLFCKCEIGSYSSNASIRQFIDCVVQEMPNYTKYNSYECVLYLGMTTSDYKCGNIYMAYPDDGWHLVGNEREDITNKVTSIGAGSTDTQYPSAKCVYNNISLKENVSNKISSWSSTTTNDHYPSEKLVKDSLDEKLTVPETTGTEGQFLKKTSTGTQWADIPASVSIGTAKCTLTSTGWNSNSQTVTVTGITTNNIVIISPDPASVLEFDADKIILTTQSLNSLTFTCVTTPTVNIVINIMIIEVP